MQGIPVVPITSHSAFRLVRPASSVRVHFCRWNAFLLAVFIQLQVRHRFDRSSFVAR
jgi:hypothetical protein